MQEVFGLGVALGIVGSRLRCGFRFVIFVIQEGADYSGYFVIRYVLYGGFRGYGVFRWFQRQGVIRGGVLEFIIRVRVQVGFLMGRIFGLVLGFGNYFRLRLGYGLEVLEFVFFSLRFYFREFVLGVEDVSIWQFCSAKFRLVLGYRWCRLFFILRFQGFSSCFFFNRRLLFVIRLINIFCLIIWRILFL